MTITIPQPLLTDTHAVPADADSTTLVAYLERTPGWQRSATIPGEHGCYTYRRVNGALFAGYGIDVPFTDDMEWCAEVAEAINAIAAGRAPLARSI